MLQIRFLISLRAAINFLVTALSYELSLSLLFLSILTSASVCFRLSYNLVIYACRLRLSTLSSMIVASNLLLSSFKSLRSLCATDSSVRRVFLSLLNYSLLLANSAERVESDAQARVASLFSAYREMFRLEVTYSKSTTYLKDP